MCQARRMTFNSSDGWDDRGLESGIGKAASAFALLWIINTLFVVSSTVLRVLWVVCAGRGKLAVFKNNNPVYTITISGPSMCEFVGSFLVVEILTFNLCPGVLETLCSSHHCCYTRSVWVPVVHSSMTEYSNQNSLCRHDRLDTSIPSIIHGAVVESPCRKSWDSHKEASQSCYFRESILNRRRPSCRDPTVSFFKALFNVSHELRARPYLDGTGTSPRYLRHMCSNYQ